MCKAVCSLYKKNIENILFIIPKSSYNTVFRYCLSDTSINILLEKHPS